MKKTFLAGVLLVIGIAFTLSAQVPKSIAARSQAMGTSLAQQGPYTYIIPVDLTGGNWVCPDSVDVEGVYFGRFTKMQFKPSHGDSLTMPHDSLSAWPWALNTIYKAGTDSLSRPKGNIFIICHKRFGN